MNTKPLTFLLTLAATFFYINGFVYGEASEVKTNILETGRNETLFGQGNLMKSVR